MQQDSVVRFRRPGEVRDELTERLRSGARRLLEEAIAVELEEFLTALSDRRDAHGRRAVVRNGFQPEREILTGIGPVGVKLPKVRSRDGEPALFRSKLVPPYVRRTRSLDVALPWLYLHGVSTGDMAPDVEAIPLDGGSPVRLHERIGSRPLVLIFGSYT